MKYRQKILRFGLCVALAVAPLSLMACGGKDKAEKNGDEVVEDPNASTINDGKLMQGLRIAGVPVGDMKADDALGILTPVLDQQLAAMTVSIVTPEQPFTYAAKDLGVSVDLSTMINNALAYENDPTIKAQAEASGYDVPLIYILDNATLSAGLMQLSGQIDREVVEPTLSFTPDSNERFTVTPGQEGRSLDIATLSASIQQAVSTGVFPIVVQATITTSQPTVTEDSLRQNVQKIVTFSTPFSGSADRTANLVLGAQKLNGTVIKAGDTFSFNDVVGPRDEARGWKKAATIVNGSRFEDDYGGGICQVSTTLYNAILKADLKITKRSKHSIPSNYIEEGLDATVSYGSLDFKFLNNTDYPVYIFSNVSQNDSRIYVSVYGRPLPNGERIILRSKRLSTQEPGPAEVMVDETLSGGQEVWEVQRRNGFTVQVYKEYMVGDQIVRTENMYQDTYSPVAGVKRVSTSGAASSNNSGSSNPFESDSNSGNSGGSSSDNDSSGIVDFDPDSGSDSGIELPSEGDGGSDDGGGEEFFDDFPVFDE